MSLDFWDGFFNPTFWPALALRFALAVMLAGLFGFATSLGIAEAEARETMLRLACRWVLTCLPVLLLAGWWYVGVLPAPVRTSCCAGPVKSSPTGWPIRCFCSWSALAPWS